MPTPTPRRECREFFSYPSTAAGWAAMEHAARSGSMTDEAARLYNLPGFFVNVYPETATEEDLDRCVKAQLLVVAWQNAQAAVACDSVDNELKRLARLFEVQRRSGSRGLAREGGLDPAEMANRATKATAKGEFDA